VGASVRLPAPALRIGKQRRTAKSSGHAVARIDSNVHSVGVGTSVRLPDYRQGRGGRRAPRAQPRKEQCTTPQSAKIFGVSAGGQCRRCYAPKTRSRTKRKNGYSERHVRESFSIDCRPLFSDSLRCSRRTKCAGATRPASPQSSAVLRCGAGSLGREELLAASFFLSLGDNPSAPRALGDSTRAGSYCACRNARRIGSVVRCDAGSRSPQSHSSR